MRPRPTFLVPALLLGLLSLAPRTAAASEAEALLLTGKQHLKEGEFKQATACFRKAKQLDAPGAKAQLTLSRSLSRASRRLASRRLASAKRALDEAAAIEAAHPQLVRLRAELARWDALLARRGSLPGGALLRRTKHFRIRHHHPYLADRVARAAETHLKAVLRDLAYPGLRRPRLKPLHLRVHRDRAEYLNKTGDLGPLSTGMAVSATKIVTFQRAVLGILKHEITHLVIHHYLPLMPLWIHEGLASGGYRQASARPYALALRCLKQKQFMTWKELLALPSLSAFKIPRWAFYLQSRLLVEFLLFARGDMEQFHSLGREAHDRAQAAIKRFVRTQTGRVTVDPLQYVNPEIPRLLRELYGFKDLSALDAAFRRYLEHRVREAAAQARERPATCHFKATHRLESQHVVLFTTCSQKVAKPLLALAERVRHAFYREFWGAGLLVPKRVKVYLFDRQKEYAAFLRARGMMIQQGRHGVLPHFNPLLGAACLYRAGLSKDYLHQVTAHEVAHFLSWNLMRHAGARAAWLIEGIAHYVSLSVHAKSKRVALGQIHETTKSKAASYLKTMDEQGALAPLPSFLPLGMGGLRTVQAHVQSWGLFHFLQHAEGGAYRTRFRAYLAQICSGGKGHRAGFEQHLGSTRELDAPFKKYVRRLKPTSKRR